MGRSKAHWRAAVLIVAMAAGFGPAAQAATHTTSFNVTATVVATCTLLPAPTAGRAAPVTCRPPPGAARVLTAPPPVVTMTRDSNTGARVRIVEF